MQQEISNIRNRDEAGEAIEEFFRIYHLVEAKEELETLQETVIKDGVCKTGQRCEELIYFCEKLKELIQAAHQFRKCN
jgi:hypothetical protein